MSFAIYIVYLVLIFLRPVEAFARELEVYRPMAILGALALAAALVSFLVHRRSAARPRHFVLLFALVACIAISVAATGWMGGALEAITKFSSAATLFVLTVLNVTTRRRFLATITTVVACTVVLATASILAYHFGFMEDRLVQDQNNAANVDTDTTFDPDEGLGYDPAVLRRVKSLGFLNDPNDFAQAMVMVSPLLLCVFARGRWIRNFALIALPGAALMYAIYLTHSRGAIVGLLAAIAFIASRRLGKIWAGAVVVALLVAVLATNMTGGRGFSTDEESAGGRIDAWSEGLGMLKSKPIFGVGFGNFTEYNDLTAHNSFVLCFAELGIVGYFVWLGMIVAPFTELGALTAGDDKRSFGVKWSNAIRAAMVGFLTCAWFLSRTYVDTLYLLLGLALSLVYIEGAIYAPNRVSSSSWIPRTAFALASSVVIVYITVLAKHVM